MMMEKMAEKIAKTKKALEEMKKSVLGPHALMLMRRSRKVGTHHPYIDYIRSMPAKAVAQDIPGRFTARGLLGIGQKFTSLNGRVYAYDLTGAIHRLGTA